ncbi:MAG: cytochrome c oxidase subunit 3 [Alphaproteobacteria bacterium]|nr:cytochrome c oxidase subunit 3 [Alphaproteobacteria bacterium]
MSESSHGNHPYHLVEPSKWPIVGAVGALLTMSGLVMFMHDDALGLGLQPFFETIGLWVIAPGVVVTMMTMMGWWRDVIDEATVQKLHTSFVQLGLRYGMALFIASEVMFFSAFFWAFFDASLFPKEAAGFVWPPEGIEIFKPFDLPLLNTIILLTSGFTVTWAHHDIREGNMKHATRMLGVTVGLGFLFTLFQIWEYSHAPFAFTDGIYPTTFFLATGFHGFHVIIGTLFLAVNWVRCAKGHFEPDHHFGFEAAAWYWHFVDVVWLFLFTFIYVWSSL